MATPSSNGNSIKALSIIHKAMLTGQLLFGLLAFYLSYSNIFQPTLQQEEKLLQVMAIVFSVAGFLGGGAIFKKRLLQAKEIPGNVHEKFAVYRSASILQWALIEGPCLFSIICFLLAGNRSFLALAIALILVFAMQTPSRGKIALQLQLSEREMIQLENENEL